MTQYQDRQVFTSDINLIKLVIGETKKRERETSVFYFNNCTVHLYYLHNTPFMTIKQKTLYAVN